jgi:hypothetical protein
MTEQYFVVLQLPGGSKPRFTGKNNTPNFWGKASDAISSGKARIVSRRQDTGISEELRSFAEKEKSFKTYVLLNLFLTPNTKDEIIFRKAVHHLNACLRPTVIDTTEKFELVGV